MSGRRPPAPEAPRPVLAGRPDARVRVRWRAVQDDPVSFLARHAGQPRFLHWRGDVAVAGVGVGAQVEASGPDRFQRVRDAARDAQSRLDAAPGDPLPRWQAGFSFEDVSDAGPTAQAVLPRQQLVVGAGQAVLLTVGDDADAPPPPTQEAPPDAGPLEWRPEPPFEVWATQVREALHAIRAGQADKLVLARRVAAPRPRGDFLPRVLRRLRAAAPSSAVFLYEPVPGQAIVGASPEVLVERTPERVRTVALAGSRPRGRNPGEDQALERTLLASSKDAWEQELVAKFIRGVLERRGGQWRVTHERRILKLPHVQHIETRFESAPRPGEHVLDLAALLHPTPAVAGFPQAAALDILARLEGTPRAAYAGATGWFDAEGNGELAVAIRAATTDGHVTAWAGCGIVNGSDPAEEWEESRSKLQLLTDAFDLGAAT